MTNPDDDPLQEFSACSESNALNEPVLIVPAIELGIISGQNWTLESLAAQITPQNLHAEQDFGHSIEYEVW